jgi:hypothetical protein
MAMRDTDTIPSGLDDHVTLTQGSSVTRNPGLEEASPLGLKAHHADVREMPQQRFIFAGFRRRSSGAISGCRVKKVHL